MYFLLVNCIPVEGVIIIPVEGVIDDYCLTPFRVVRV